ncbi:MAG: 16S rRNA (adenine(1518)-N(6)/adenine(1519)-N(6))-dimethyltransferase RsmA [Thermodesulfobacteriota bacterium]|nr:16S rRNA (adenine(1518)-N(6)/adenine(1519)-N(6))-dimethyltransferase RsmA [Thermodesulfobacteriota bacterium]
MKVTKPITRGNRFRPKKRFGQHFLEDTEIIHEILTKADFNKSDRVLEVGPGYGALTIPMAGLVHEIIAVEKDSYLTRMLRKKLSRSGINNVRLIHDDILSLDCGKTLPLIVKKIKVIGNLPYTISSPFLDKLINCRKVVNRAILMFQFEFAKRLIASPGSKAYGAITVSMQYHARLSPLLEVPKEAFYPRPKVGSMVLEFDFEMPYQKRAEDETVFKMLVKGAFAHRRKTILNSLGMALSSCSDEDILAALDKCGIDPLRRAETLDISAFLHLASALKQSYAIH